MFSSNIICRLFPFLERLDFLHWCFLDDFFSYSFLHWRFRYDFSYRLSSFLTEVFGIVKCEDRYEYDFEKSDSKSIRSMLSEFFCDFEIIDDHKYCKYWWDQNPQEIPSRSSSKFEHEVSIIKWDEDSPSWKSCFPEYSPPRDNH